MARLRNWFAVANVLVDIGRAADSALFLASDRCTTNRIGCCKCGANAACGSAVSLSLDIQALSLSLPCTPDSTPSYQIQKCCALSSFWRTVEQSWRESHRTLCQHDISTRL